MNPSQTVEALYAAIRSGDADAANSLIHPQSLLEYELRYSAGKRDHEQLQSGGAKLFAKNFIRVEAKWRSIFAHALGWVQDSMDRAWVAIQQSDDDPDAIPEKLSEEDAKFYERAGLVREYDPAVRAEPPDLVEVRLHGDEWKVYLGNDDIIPLPGYSGCTRGLIQLPSE